MACVAPGGPGKSSIHLKEAKRALASTNPAAGARSLSGGAAGSAGNATATATRARPRPSCPPASRVVVLACPPARLPYLLVQATRTSGAGVRGPSSRCGFARCAALGACGITQYGGDYAAGGAGTGAAAAAASVPAAGGEKVGVRCVWRGPAAAGRPSACVGGFFGCSGVERPVF